MNTDSKPNPETITSLYVEEKMDHAMFIAQSLDFMQDACYAWNVEDKPIIKNNLYTMGAHFMDAENTITELVELIEILSSKCEALEEQPKFNEQEKVQLSALFGSNERLAMTYYKSLNQLEAKDYEALDKTLNSQLSIVEENRGLIEALRG